MHHGQGVYQLGCVMITIDALASRSCAKTSGGPPTSPADRFILRDPHRRHTAALEDPAVAVVRGCRRSQSME
jgi:hypothetical protein